jgi:hypothetical protein
VPTKVELLLRQLRELEKSYDRLSRAVPDPQAAERNADNALQAVLNSLSDPDVAAVIDELVPTARERILANPVSFRSELTVRHEELTRLEVRLAQHSGIRRQDIEVIRTTYDKVSLETGDFFASASALRESLVTLHTSTKSQVAASRELPRIEKKKRKRNLAQGIASAVFGTAVVAANTQLPIVFAFSYGLGGGAIHQAIRDIVGSEA